MNSIIHLIIVKYMAINTFKVLYLDLICQVMQGDDY